MAENIPSTPLSPDGSATVNELMRQVRLFISGASHTSGVKISSSDLIRSAIFLLKSLPAAREAVLEHLYSVFDEFVGEYVSKIENQGDSKLNKHGTSSTYLVEDINSILTNFIMSNPESWAPIIFNWSLDLLGRLSSKYGTSKGLQPKASSIGSLDSLNDVLNLWMKCQATKTLIHLSTQCLSTLMNGNIDICIDALLDMSVQHSPYFDWFIAHIGSCFPNMIITRVLACGLKDFCSGTPNQPVAVSQKVPKIASVVEILGHLIGQHHEQIKDALLCLARDSMDATDPNRLQLAVLPFLLQLASMSPPLLSALMPDIIPICLNKEALMKMPKLAEQWHVSGLLHDKDRLLKSTYQLVLQNSENGSRLLSFLLDTASVNDHTPQLVKQTCYTILDVLISELQILVYTSSTEIPLFSSVATDLQFVSKHITGPQTPDKMSWICQFLSFLCLKTNESISSQILAIVLQKCSEISILISILDFIQQSYPDALPTAVIRALTNISCDDFRLLFTNLTTLMKDSDKKDIVAEDVAPHLDLVSEQLNHSDCSISSAALNLLVLVPIMKHQDFTVMTKIAYEIVYLIYNKLCKNDRDKIETESVIKKCSYLLSLLSSNSSMLYLVIRQLVLESFSEKNAVWFGNTLRKNTAKNNKSFSLIDDNSKHSRSLPLPQSHSAVLYAGVIGNGIRIPEVLPLINDVVIIENRNYLISILVECCTANAKDDRPSIESMSKLSLLLVELVSPDVMFNGLPWPEEDFLKVTMERDIAINKMLNDNPILWDILFLVAKTKPALCYCSVLLRGVAATLLSFWSSCQEKSAKNCPKVLETSCKLVTLMSLGELIPPPLSQIGDILQELEPYEVYVVFNDMWKYMSDNVPSPDSFCHDEFGEMVRNSSLNRAPEKYTVRLRHIMQSKIHKLGFLYPRMFLL